MILTVPFIICLLSGCDALFHRNIDEGRIVFEISYPKTEIGDVMASMLPSEMHLRFKDNRTAGELVAGMGLFQTSLIADPNTKVVYQLLKLMNKKYVVKSDSTEIKGLYSELPEMQVVKTNETKEIIGYKCKRAIVKFEGNIKEEFSIFYTEEISIANSNWCTPFHDIKGVLLEYNVRKYNYEMKLEAVEIVKEEIDNSYFEIPDDYEIIGKEEMDKIFEGFKEI
ncbi:MAG TPA: hypothetical protein EYN89_05475 [Flavobacteriales bacterium]|nr:hypothetical protein [Flavobacteriales bacterium]